MENKDHESNALQDFEVNVKSQLLVDLIQSQMHVERKQEQWIARQVQLEKKLEAQQKENARLVCLVAEIHHEVVKKRKREDSILDQEKNGSDDNETKAPAPRGTSGHPNTLAFALDEIRQVYIANRNAIFKEIRDVRFPVSTSGADNYLCPILIAVKSDNFRKWPAVFALDFLNVPDEVFTKVRKADLNHIRGICRQLPVRWLYGKMPTLAKQKQVLTAADSYFIVNLYDQKNVVSYEHVRGTLKERANASRKVRKSEEYYAALDQAEAILEKLKKDKQAFAESLVTGVNVEAIMRPFN